MAIQQLLDDVLFVELPPTGSKIGEELNAVNEMVSSGNTSHVIIDFRRVELLNSWNISTLLALRGLLQETDKRLVFCNVRMVTRCIFAVAGLRKVFEFAANQEKALSFLNNSGTTTSKC